MTKIKTTTNKSSNSCHHTITRLRLLAKSHINPYKIAIILYRKLNRSCMSPLVKLRFILHKQHIWRKQLTVYWISHLPWSSIFGVWFWHNCHHLQPTFLSMLDYTAQNLKASRLKDQRPAASTISVGKMSAKIIWCII